MYVPIKKPKKKMQTLNIIKKDPKLENCYIKLKMLDQDLIKILTKKDVNTNNGQIVADKFKNNLETFSSNNSINQTDDDNNNNYGEDFDDLLKSENIKNWSLEDFQIGKLIGKGRFGRCFLAREKKTPAEFFVALKILDLAKLKADENENVLQQEYTNQIKLHHPNIIRLCGHFYDDKKVYLMLEYAPHGNLFTKIINDQITNELAAKYIYQTTKALIYLHSQNIIHRDLKPENILLGVFDEIKIADFGWSREDNGKNECETAGTIEYLCPEMLEKKPHNKRVDNWCLGVLCYELLAGYSPFHIEGEDNEAKDIKIFASIKSLNYAKEKIKNSDALILIDKLLQKVPEKRLELVEVMKNKWIIDFADKDDSYEKYFNSYWRK